MVNLEGGLEVDIDTNVDRLRNHNGRFMKGIPDMEEDMAERFAKDIEEGIKETVRRKFERFEGDLYDNVKARKSSSNNGVAFEVTANAYSSKGVNYAAWHEFANTGHEASVSGDLKRWAAQKGILNDVGQTIEVNPINQTEGSFMEPGIQKAISKARRRMRSGRNSVSENMQNSFR